MDFEYDKGPAIVNLVIWLLAVVWLMVLLVLLRLDQLSFILLVGTVLAFAVIVVGISPLLTSHNVEEDRIVIRQGWHSRITVPKDQVKSVQRMDRIEIKEGVILDAFNRTLVMTGSKKNGVRIELKNEIRVPSTFWKKVGTVILDVNEPERFMAAIDKS
jgi:membrane protein YdbS with pleckstrin-like domain